MFGPSTIPPFWLKTDLYGRIQSVAPEAAKLLGFSARGAWARDLRLFFPASFGPLTDMVRLAGSEPVESTLDLYPRDRGRVRVLVRIEPSSDGAARTALRWTLDRRFERATLASSGSQGSRERRGGTGSPL